MITCLIVTENVSVEISYKAEDGKEDNGQGSGCGGCNSSALASGMAVLIGALGGCMLMCKKEESDDEEV